MGGTRCTYGFGHPAKHAIYMEPVDTIRLNVFHAVLGGKEFTLHSVRAAKHASPYCVATKQNTKQNTTHNTQKNPRQVAHLRLAHLPCTPSRTLRLHLVGHQKQGTWLDVGGGIGLRATAAHRLHTDGFGPTCHVSKRRFVQHCEAGSTELATTTERNRGMYEG